MPSGNADPRFAERLRELLDSRGLSYRALAARTHYGKSTIHDLATGKKRPSHDVAHRLDDALAAGGQLAVLAGAPSPSPLPHDGWTRRHNEDLADALVTEPPTPDNAVRLAHDWLITDPPQVFELRSGRRVGTATVERIERRVHQLRQLDDHVGGSQTHALLTAELRATSALLREAAYPEEVGRRLLIALSDLCQLAGFVAADAGHHQEAVRLHLAGVRAAHAGGDPVSAANNLSSAAYVLSNVGDPRHGVILARSAWTGAKTTATRTAAALLAERLAWAHARVGEAAPAERALDAVEDVYEPYEAGVDPPWAYWLTTDETEVMAGRVWTQLRRPLRAVPILDAAVARYGDDRPRETALYLTWLAESLLLAEEVEQAADAAMRALRMARRAQSHRARQRVELIGRQLARYRGNASVATFEDELSAG